MTLFEFQPKSFGRLLRENSVKIDTEMLDVKLVTSTPKYYIKLIPRPAEKPMKPITYEVDESEYNRISLLNKQKEIEYTKPPTISPLQWMEVDDK